MSNPLYGPYGTPGGMPALIGGIDDGASLRLSGIFPDQIDNGWYPQLAPGRYAMRSEPGFRYQFVRPQSATVSVGSGRASVAIPLPTAAFSAAVLGEAPFLLAQGATGLSPVAQSVRFGYPVHTSNTTNAVDFVDPTYLTDPEDTDSNYSPLHTTDVLWWQPTFGAEVLAVHRSRNARSYDVLSDGDAVLQEVSTPDQLSDDRCYCVDRSQGLVFGRMPSATLPPPPFSSGANAQTYVTFAYPTESDPRLADAGISAASSTYWTNYFTSRASFYTSYEGSSTFKYYDPLRLEEICVVDRDGLVRTRRIPSQATGYLPTAIFLAPDGYLACTVSGISSNLFEVLVHDPSQSNALAPLPYGTTVIVRYYVDSTFALESLTTADDGTITAHIATFLPNTTPVTLTYETDPLGLTNLRAMNGQAPDLNPLTTATRSGFLWIEAQDAPVAPAPSQNGAIELSTGRPCFNGSTGEVFTIRCAAFDRNGAEICGAPLALTVSPSGALNLASATVTTGQDGYALFRAQVVSVGSDNTGITVSLTDTRNSGQVLATSNLLPSRIGGSESIGITAPWEPSIFLALGEAYQSVGDGVNSVQRKYLRVVVQQSDGFPWDALERIASGRNPMISPILVLTSTASVFHNAQNGGDTILGSQVQIPYDNSSGFVSPSGLVKVGYTPVAGDVITAQFYVAESTYLSAPLVVS